MTSILDIIAGLVIGGMIFLLTLVATDTGMRNFVNYNADAIVQNQLAHTAQIIEDDLRKIGYGIPQHKTSTIIQLGDPDHIKFLSHLNLNFKYNPNLSLDEIPDTIEYQIVLADTIQFPDTTISIYNMWRTIKITPNYTNTSLVGKIANSDVFQYLDQIGQPVEIIQATKMVEVTLIALNQDVILSPEMVSQKLQGIENEEFRKKELLRLLKPSFWRQTRLVSKNLKR